MYLLFSCEMKRENSLCRDLASLYQLEGGRQNYVLVVPLDGCDGCVMKCIHSIRKIGETDRVIAVLTNRDPMKLLEGESILEQKNVISDKENQLLQYGHDIHMPTIINLETCSITALDALNVDVELKKIE